MRGNVAKEGGIIGSQIVISDSSGKTPLLECTNNLSLTTIVEEAREQKINYKGQWKRRARMKVVESIKKGKIDQTVEGNDRLKRKRGSLNENFLEDTEEK